MTKLEAANRRCVDLQRALDDKLLNAVCRELSFLAGKKRWSAAQGKVYTKLRKILERYMNPETDRIESRDATIKSQESDIKHLSARIGTVVELVNGRRRTSLLAGPALKTFFKEIKQALADPLEPK